MNKIDHAVDKALEELKSKCIDAIEDNFNLYLLNDLSDVGEVSELFDKEDWYLYYLECAWQLNPLIDGLLKDKGKNKESLLKAIALKRIIDERLMFFSNNNFDMIFDDLGFDRDGIDRKVIQLSDSLKEADLFLKSSFDELIKRNWIKSNFENFKSNFINTENQVPINWIYKQLYLVGFFKYLVNKQYLNLGDQKAQQVIARHFHFKGKRIKISSIEPVYSNMFSTDGLSEEPFKFIDNYKMR